MRDELGDFLDHVSFELEGQPLDVLVWRLGRV